MSKKIINAPPIGYQEGIPIEKNPMFVEHMLKNMDFLKTDNLMEKKEVEWARNEMRIEGVMTGLNSFKFVFDNDNVIDADSIRIEIAISNNNMNYLQLDGSPHSLIKSTKWTINNKIVEYINDYDILLSFLNDLTFKSNKYNNNRRYYHNEDEPLLMGTREDLVYPTIFGTNSIFNLTAITRSYIKEHDITDGMIDMRISKYHTFSIPIFSYIFCNGPNKKNQYLDLGMFRGLELEIELNEYAFFVPCFSAHINNLLDIYNQGDIKFITKEILYNDYSLINKLKNFKINMFKEKLYGEDIEMMPHEEDVYIWDKQHDKYNIDLDFEDKPLNYQYNMEIEQPKKKPEIDFDLYFDKLYVYFANVNMDNIYISVPYRYLSYLMKLYYYIEKNIRGDELNLEEAIPSDFYLYNLLIKAKYVFKISKNMINGESLFNKKFFINNSDYTNINDVEKFNLTEISNIITTTLNVDHDYHSNLKAHNIVLQKIYPLYYYYLSFLFYNDYEKLFSVSNKNMFNEVQVNKDFCFCVDCSAVYYRKKKNLTAKNSEFTFANKKNKQFINNITDVFNEISKTKKIKELYSQKDKKIVVIKNSNEQEPTLITPKYLLTSNFMLLKRLKKNGTSYISFMNGKIYTLSNPVIVEEIFEVGKNGLVMYIFTFDLDENKNKSVINNDLNNIDLFFNVITTNIRSRQESDLYNIIKNLIHLVNINEMNILYPLLMSIIYSLNFNLNKQKLLDFIKNIFKQMFSNLFKNYLNLTVNSGVKLLDDIINNILMNEENIERSIIMKDWYQSSKDYNNLNNIIKRKNINLSRNYNVYKIAVKYRRLLTKVKTSPWKGSSTIYIQADKRDFNTHLPMKIYFGEPGTNISRIYQFILSRAFEKYPTCRFTSRYNRQIKNYWVETNYGRYPPDEELNGASETTANSVNNFIFYRLSNMLDLSKSNLNVFNTSIDNNTQMYITKKMNAQKSKMIIFNDTINLIDYFSFGYLKEVQSRALFGISLADLRQKLGVGNNQLKDFNICFENSFSYDYKDYFSLYTLYTYSEGSFDYAFDTKGNILGVY